jgi:hypothetical protein
MAKLMLIVIPLMGLLLPFLVLLAVAAASFGLSHWRTERDRILRMPEARDLDWPSLDHPVVLKKQSRREIRLAFNPKNTIVAE